MPELLERFGGTEAVQADQDDAATRVALSRGVDGRDGTTCYELVADAVSRATLEAAIGPLSRPQPSPDGTPDARSAEHRRGQALFEVCRRVSHTAAAFTGAPSSSPAQPSSPNGEPAAPPARPAGSTDQPPDRAPTEGTRNAVPEVERTANGKARSTQSAWAQSKEPVPSCVSEVPVGVRSVLFVTMTMGDLMNGTGVARTVGPPGHGTAIASDTARRLACDAGIIPVVLGTHGEILDLGRQSRLFTYAQTKALWLRDGGCTYPGCDVPPFWCDGHHLVHWADGGASDLLNAALLCGPHHDMVHRAKLLGAVRPDGTGVDWNLSPGSYLPPLRR